MKENIQTCLRYKKVIFLYPYKSQEMYSNLTNSEMYFVYSPFLFFMKAWIANTVRYI